MNRRSFAGNVGGAMRCPAFLFAILALLPGVSRAAGLPPVETPAWVEVAPGVWRATIGTPESLTLLGAAGGLPPKTAALRALPPASFPFAPAEIETRRWGAKTAVRLPLAADEDIYGLGVDFAGLRRNGAIFELHVDHWDSRRGITGRTHAPVPLYVSSRGFAVLFDAARYLQVSVGHGVRLAAKEQPPVIDRTTNTIRPARPGDAPVPQRWQAHPRSDSIEVLARAAGLEVYVFAGPTALDAVRRYNLFTGGGALPPKWGLGFLNRVRTQYTAEQVLADIEEFRRQGLPLDMIGLEPGWMDHAYPCSLRWDPVRFPDPGAFLAAVHRHRVRVNLWFNPYVGPAGTPLQARLLAYAGTHLVWNGIVPDYSLPEARRILSDHLRAEILDRHPAAVGGFKVDEVDGYDRYLWPETAVFPSGRDAEQLRQTYGLLVQQAVWTAFREAGRRTMGQVRGTNAGASPYPFVIYNDNYEFEGYLTAVCNSGFAGVLWSPEVRGSNSGLDMLRRTQAVCFSPLALYNGWASSQKLWTHAEVRDPIRAALVLRLRLLPYLYTAFAQYHHEGTPLIRPMPLALQGRAEAAPAAAGRLDATHNPYAVPPAAREVKDQYLLGDSLLVAPLAPNAKSRRVLLPPGRWYDFFTGRLAGADQTIEVTPSLAEIPLFVRDGALIPLLAGEWQHVPASGERAPLEIRHYGGAPGRGRVYDDDGETFAYERGEFTWTQLAAERDTAGAWRGRIEPGPGGRDWSYGEVRWRFMTAP